MATPPFVPGTVPIIPSQTQDPTEKTRQLLSTLVQAAQRRQVNPQFSPAPVPGMVDANQAAQIGMNTGNPHAWGTQQFLGRLGANLQNAVATKKREQLASAEGDWSYLLTAMNELHDAEQSGDKNAVAAAQKKVDAATGDPKKLKNMAKALNMDWLNPEKTTVYGEALKKVVAQSREQDAHNDRKQQAAAGIKKMITTLLGQKQALQQKAALASMSNEDKQKMAREIQAKAPTTSVLDKETALALREDLKAQEKAEEDERKAKLKQEEDERKEAAKQKELQEKADQEKEIIQMRDKLQSHRDQVQNQFHTNMESMKELAAERRQNAHDLTMFKMLGMKLDAQQEKLFKADSGKIDKEVNESVQTLRQQYAQAQQSLRSLKSSASNHWLLGPGKEEIADAQSNVDNLQKAIAHIEKNRDAIVKGKAELSDVIEKAYSIMGGEAGDASAVPGFVPDK